MLLLAFRRHLHCTMLAAVGESRPKETTSLRATPATTSVPILRHH